MRLPRSVGMQIGEYEFQSLLAENLIIALPARYNQSQRRWFSARERDGRTDNQKTKRLLLLMFH